MKLLDILKILPFADLFINKSEKKVVEEEKPPLLKMYSGNTYTQQERICIQQGPAPMVYDCEIENQYSKKVDDILYNDEFESGVTINTVEPHKIYSII